MPKYIIEKLGINFNVEYLIAVVLGFVQGAMEFLPVSSSGHIVLLSRWFNIGETLTLSIILHVATLLSVVVVFWRPILELIKKPFSKKSLMIVLACTCTAVIAIIFKKFFLDSFGGALLPYSFIITAVLLLVTQFLTQKIKIGEPLNYKTATLVGFAQGIAILPGISRSGSTICAALLAKTDREEAADFSFIISLPIIVASAVFDIISLASSGEGVANALSLPWPAILVSFIIAFVVGVFCVKFMRKLTTKNVLWPFSVYLIIIAVLAFIF